MVDFQNQSYLPTIFPAMWGDILLKCWLSIPQSPLVWGLPTHQGGFCLWEYFVVW